MSAARVGNLCGVIAFSTKNLISSLIFSMAGRSALSSSKVFSSSNSKKNHKSTFKPPNHKKFDKKQKGKTQPIKPRNESQSDEEIDDDEFGNGTVGKFNIEDDEEIDSDEAWGEGISDEEPLDLKKRTALKDIKGKAKEAVKPKGKGKGKQPEKRSVRDSFTNAVL
jgi:hypothetical protein